MNTRFTASADAGVCKLAIMQETLPLTQNSEEVFVALFGKSENAFWLDSSLVVPGLSRWSFMGEVTDGEANICLFDAIKQEVSLTGAGGSDPRRINQTIFDHMSDQMNRNRFAPTQGLPDLPFLGGYVGYFGYELKSLTCGVSSHPASVPDAAFLFVTRFLAFDHETGELHLVAVHPLNDSDAASSWIRDVKKDLTSLPMAQQVAMPSDPLPAPQFVLRHDRQAYLDRIDRCLQEIAAGETYEVCLTNEISAEVSVDPLDLYQILRRRNPAPYAAYLRFGSIAIASSSPERFLRIDREGVAESKPIKGTARRDADPSRDAEIAEALRLDEKSRSENLMIVDLLRNDLGRVCETGSVHVPSLMHIESYRTVHQLVSVIRGTLRTDETMIGCIASCFPGGSMTGAPKIRTLQLIDELEGKARGVYSGSIGYLSLGGDVDLNIVIRTIVVTPGKVSVGCGGAIVALSDPADEFDEILLKAHAPLAAITEAVTGESTAAYSVIGASGGEPASEVGTGARRARPGEEAAIADALNLLLTELGGPGPEFSLQSAQRVIRDLIEAPEQGFVLLVEDQYTKRLIGVATVTAARAARAGGRYGILQELWVASGYRSHGIGQQLLDAVDREAQQREWPMIEVVLPNQGHADLERVSTFYASADYAPTGLRWRKRLER